MASVTFSEPRFAIVMHDGSIEHAGLTRSEAYSYAESYNALADQPCRVTPCQVLVDVEDEVAPC